MAFGSEPTLKEALWIGTRKIVGLLAKSEEKRK